MSRGPVVAALLVTVGGVCLQVRGNSGKVLTDSMSASYLTRTSARKSVEGLIGAGAKVGKTSDAPWLVSQVHESRQHRVALSWSPSVPTSIKGEELISGYNIYRRREIGTMYTRYTRINSDLVTDTNYVDDSVGAGLSYGYVTTAVSYGGVESRPSNRIRVQIPYP